MAPRLDALTSLRALAALWVVFFHARGTLLSEWLPGQARWLQNFAELGFAGVPFFFVLSGFILGYTYLSRATFTAGPTRAGSRRQFYAARVARIYPVYLLALVLTAGFFLADFHTRGAAFLAGNAVATVLLAQAWLPAFAPTWNGVGWSLSVEAFFYLTFPFWCRRIGTLPAHGCARWLAGLTLIAAATLLVLTTAVPVLAAPIGEYRSADVALVAARFNPLLHLPGFLAGIVLARWHLLDPATPGVAPGAATWALLGVSVLGLALLVPFARSVPMLWLHNLICAIPAGGLIAATARLNDRLPWLSWRPAVLLGEASYALYLTHFWTLRVYLKVFRGLEGREVKGVGHTLAYTAAALLVALAVYAWLEKPARPRVLRRLAPAGSPATG